MKRHMLWVAPLFCGVVLGQDLTGDWQGSLKVGAKELRLIVHVEKGMDTAWKAGLASIDQSPDRGAMIPANSVTLEGTEVKINFPAIHGSYRGAVNSDGNSITGAWTQGSSLPLELKRATPETAWKDPSPHSIQFITVGPGVKLEVLDWGGSGRPAVLIPGLGNTAHIFDQFALKLTPKFHVYGITRRGFGASSAPSTGYQADRLGDDVLAVLDTLKIDKPVLVGHSLGGEELSSVGSRHPERVAGLIYLDAGYSYAFYNAARGDLQIDLAELEKKLADLHPGNGPADTRPLIKELLDSDLPAFERDLREQQKDLDAMPKALLAMQSAVPVSGPAKQIMAGIQKYSKIPAPILAIFAVPHDLGPLTSRDQL